MFLISIDSIKANDTSHIIIGGNSFGYEFQIIVTLLIAILVVLVTAWLSIKKHLCQHNTNNNNNTKKNENNINSNNNLINQQGNEPMLLSAPSPKPIEGNPTESPSSSPSSNSPSFTLTKRTCIKTTIKCAGKDTVTITKTKTEAIDIPSNIPIVYSMLSINIKYLMMRICEPLYL